MMCEYAVVDFDDRTEIVPSIWLEPDKKKCKWPPYTDKTIITEAISKRVTPTHNWETYEVVRIRATTATLEAATRQLKRAEENSDTSHNIQAEKQETSPAVSVEKKETTMYAIVDFDDGTEIVPLIWLEPDEKNCKWPPYTDKTRITQAISERVTPPNDWETYEVVRIHATTATLDAAILELKWVEENSDMGHNVQAEEQETSPGVSVEKKDLEDQNNPPLPMLDTQVERLDDLKKSINMLVHAMDANVRSLVERISEMEKGRTKPLVQQDVTVKDCQKKTVLLSDEEQLESLKSKVDKAETNTLESVVLNTKKIVPEIEQNVATKSNILKKSVDSDKYISEPTERKLNYSMDENNTKPLLPVPAPKDKKEDHLIKMTEKLLSMQADTNKSMDLLRKKISLIEDNISKPVVQQNVTTKYDTKEELPVGGGGKLPMVQNESILTTNLEKSTNVKEREIQPTVEQASHRPLDIKGDSSIVKKENLPSSYYQTDNALPKSRFEESNDPYSDKKKQLSTFTEKKSLAEGAESYRSNNSSDFGTANNVILYNHASHRPLDIERDSPIFKKKILPLPYYQTDNTLSKYRSKEWNDPYSDTEEQWSTFTERKSRAKRAESYRSNNSSNCEMIRYSQHYETRRQTSCSSVSQRTTKKHDNFVYQPVVNQPVTALPGIGRVLGERLASAGYSQARQVREKFISMGEDRGRFQTWLHSVSNANSRQSADCYYGLCDWD